MTDIKILLPDFFSSPKTSSDGEKGTLILSLLSSERLASEIVPWLSSRVLLFRKVPFIPCWVKLTIFWNYPIWVFFLESGLLTGVRKRYLEASAPYPNPIQTKPLISKWTFLLGHNALTIETKHVADDQEMFGTFSLAFFEFALCTFLFVDFALLPFLN